MMTTSMNIKKRSPWFSEPIRSYSELSKLTTFKERYDYLKLSGRVGIETFGFDRQLNQILYQRNPRWRRTRDEVIIRDNGCDLGMEGHEIHGKILVHHMNPITIDDVLHDRDWIYDPEFLICTMHTTHNAIHYGDENQLVIAPTVRTKNDTCPWRTQG